MAGTARWAALGQPDNIPRGVCHLQVNTSLHGYRFSQRWSAGVSHTTTGQTTSTHYWGTGSLTTGQRAGSGCLRGGFQRQRGRDRLRHIQAAAGSNHYCYGCSVQSSESTLTGGSPVLLSRYGIYGRTTAATTRRPQSGCSSLRFNATWVFAQWRRGK